MINKNTESIQIKQEVKKNIIKSVEGVLDRKQLEILGYVFDTKVEEYEFSRK